MASELVARGAAPAGGGGHGLPEKSTARNECDPGMSGTRLVRKSERVLPGGQLPAPAAFRGGLRRIAFLARFSPGQPGRSREAGQGSHKWTKSVRMEEVCSPSRWSPGPEDGTVGNQSSAEPLPERRRGNSGVRSGLEEGRPPSLFAHLK